MKKILLTFALSALALGASAANLGELPLGESITLKSGDLYDFSPTENGELAITFEGSYPDNGILVSNMYNVNFNPSMEMMQQQPTSAMTWQGYTSPVTYDIRVYQPNEQYATQKVTYQVVGPEDGSSLKMKATFQPQGAIEDIKLVALSQTPGGVFNFNASGSLAFTFEPTVSDLTCSSLVFDMFVGTEKVKSIQGSQQEMFFERQPGIGYQINLTNLWDYELKDTDIDSFTIIMSGFNYDITGEYVNADGQVVLHYLVDEWYGMITVEGTPSWPSYIYPKGASPSTMTITYSGDLDATSGGEVVVLGTVLNDLNQEASPKTNVYSPSYTVSGNKLTIDFSKFTQIGPIDDGGQIIKTDGYRTSGSEMTIIVRNFLGTDGSQVQPLLGHAGWRSEYTGDEPGGDYPDDPDHAAVSAVGVEAGYQVYSLQGIRVLETPSYEEVKNLPAGIYIVNGRKVWNR